MPSFAMTTFVRMAMVGTAMGHLIMNSPVPFGVDTLNNSPLVDAKPGSSTSDFPCKQRAGVYDITAMNNMAVGDTQLLNFTGSASHGGGSCQVAVTMDLEPTLNSTWKVIQVFEGGCPISSDGNDGTHPFTFEIPSNFPNGRSTLSWTWYNRVGNREIYQNCAPITVTGGSDSQDYYNSLPNWYIINLPTSECSTVETTDQIIPNPGQFVLSNLASSNTLASATGPSCAASAATQTSGVSGYQTSVMTNEAAYSAPAKNGDVTGPAPSSGAAVTSAARSASVTGVATSATVGSSSASTTYMPITSSAAATSSTIAPATTSTASSSSSSTGGDGSGGTNTTGSAACSGDGTIVCSGTSQFGICNFGAVVWQDVAPGTTCSDGQITRKRDVRQLAVRREIQLIEAGHVVGRSDIVNLDEESEG